MTIPHSERARQIAEDATTMTAKEDKARTLTELADRVEALSGPCRETDGSIWWATRSLDELDHLDRTGYVRECVKRDGSAGKALAQFMDTSNPNCLAFMAFRQPYTASIDAAMTLASGQEWCGGAPGLLREAMDRLLGRWERGGPILYQEALARFFTAASLRSIASQVEG